MIGKRVRQRRLELGLTQEELAYKMGYKSKSAINKIEMDKNDVNQSKLIRLAIALDCSPSYFIETDPATSVSTDKIMEYAEKLSRLSPDRLNNAMQHIDFLSKGESE